MTSDVLTERPRALLLHEVDYDHPSAASPRLRRTLCGQWVTPREDAPHVDDVTCPRCRALRATREAINI